MGISLKIQVSFSSSEGEAKSPMINYLELRLVCFNGDADWLLSYS